MAASRRILVVSADSALSTAIADADGLFLPITATTATDALAILASLGPSIEAILVDSDHADIDANDLIGLIRKDGHPIRIVLFLPIRLPPTAPNCSAARRHFSQFGTICWGCGW